MPKKKTKKTQPAKPIPVMPPHGIAALTDPISPVVIEQQKDEQTIEVMKALMEKLSNNDLHNFEPVIFGIKDKKIIARKVKLDKDGRPIVENIDFPDKRTLAKKEKLAKQITDDLQKTIDHDMPGVIYTALIRKPLDKLKELRRKIKKQNSPPRLSQRMGCIWLEVEDDSCQL